MKTKKKLQLIGMAISFIGLALAWIFFSWKLALVLLIFAWGNNLEQKLQ